MITWMKKHLLLMAFVLLFLLGLGCVFGAYRQQPVSATVTETGKVVYHKPRTGRAKSKGKYWQDIYFTYRDKAGAEQSASFTLRTVYEDELAEVGDTINVVSWPFGWTMYPNNTIVSFGWGIAIVAVVYLIIYIYVVFDDIRAWWRAHTQQLEP